jgi:hypothetical protein
MAGHRLKPTISIFETAFQFFYTSNPQKFDLHCIFVLQILLVGSDVVSSLRTKKGVTESASNSKGDVYVID